MTGFAVEDAEATDEVALAGLVEDEAAVVAATVEEGLVVAEVERTIEVALDGLMDDDTDEVARVVLALEAREDDDVTATTELDELELALLEEELYGSVRCKG